MNKPNVSNETPIDRSPLPLPRMPDTGDAYAMPKPGPTPGVIERLLAPPLDDDVISDPASAGAGAFVAFEAPDAGGDQQVESRRLRRRAPFALVLGMGACALLVFSWLAVLFLADGSAPSAGSDGHAEPKEVRRALSSEPRWIGVEPGVPAADEPRAGARSGNRAAGTKGSSSRAIHNGTTQLVIRSNRRALVFVDGQPVGHTPISVSASLGSHMVRAALPGQASSMQNKSVDIDRADQQTVVEFTF